MEPPTNSPVATNPDMSCRRKRKRGKSRRGRSRCRKFRGGKKTRNAFLNFLRDYRRKCCGRTVSQVAKHGAKLWKCMSSKEKMKYVRMASKCPKTKRRTSCRGRSRRGHSRRGHSRRGRSRRGHSRRGRSRHGKSRKRRGSRHRSRSRSHSRRRRHGRSRHGKSKCGKTRRHHRRKSMPCPKPC